MIAFTNIYFVGVSCFICFVGGSCFICFAGGFVFYLLFVFIYIYWCPTWFPYYTMFVSFYSISETGSANPSRAHVLIPVLWWVYSAQSLVFYVVFCRSLIVFLLFFFWSLHCLTFNFRHLKCTIYGFFLFKDFQHSMLRVITHVNYKYPFSYLCI